MWNPSSFWITSKGNLGSRVHYVDLSRKCYAGMKVNGDFVMLSSMRSLDGINGLNDHIKW